MPTSILLDLVTALGAAGTVGIMAVLVKGQKPQPTPIPVRVQR